MGWNKREAVQNLVILGDEKGHKRTAGGLLIGCPVNKQYPDKQDFILVQKDGEELVLAGSASIARQLSEADIGKFVKCEFTGWGKSANGKFKVIDVNVWEGDPLPAMLEWPRYEEFKNGRPKAEAAKVTTAAQAKNDKLADDGFTDFDHDAADDDSGSDLPFQPMPWASRNPTDARALEKKKPREKPDGYSVGGWPGLDDPTPSERAMTARANPATGEALTDIPACDTSDPASLEAWHGNFSYSEHFRKVVLADAGAAERAKDALSEGKKRPETQIADDARRSEMYVTYLTEQLKGRILREQNVRDSSVGA